MYKRRSGQINALESPLFFEGVALDPSNDWVKLVEIMPWDLIDEKYAASFTGEETGNPAKSARMAIGALIIKERYGMSDEEVVKEIQMNPYLQYYIGMPGFRHQAPFDASTITRFRQRVTPEMIGEINDIVIGRQKASKASENGKAPPEEPPESDDVTPPESESVENKQESAPKNEPENELENAPENKGTLILDATCTPQNIRYPTDISLLNEGREKLEKLIDAAHEAGATEGKKPRTYRKLARRDYLRYVRNRKPTRAFRRKSIGKQLRYVRRDLEYIGRILEKDPDALNERQKKQFDTIGKVFKQQWEMFKNRAKSIKDRIVSIHQPHVRPIMRGKATAPVEFGAKVELSLVDGYIRIEKLSWDAFNEGGTLQESVECFKDQLGHYPARILADKIFRTRENLAYCKEHGIHLNGPALGRPPKDEELRKEQLQIEREESGERSAIECAIGVGKRRYTLGCVMTRLDHTSEVSIHVSVLTMNLFRKLRLSFVFFLRRAWERAMGSDLYALGKLCVAPRCADI